MQYIASEAEELMGFLENLEHACNAIASFWTKKSDKFTSQGGRMSTNERDMIKHMPANMIDKNVTYWTSTRDQLSYYATAMTTISKSCTFATDAKSPPLKYIHLPNLDVSLYFPSTTNTKRILNQ